MNVHRTIASVLFALLLGAAFICAAQPAETPPPPPMFVHVCTDAGAGAYEAFPDVCRLSDGRLMSVFYAGYGHVSLPNDALPKGGRVSCCYSSDEGKTWTPAETLYDSPDDDRDPSIMQTRSGKLLCTFFSLRTKPDNPKAWDGLGTWVVQSDDLGKTWSAPRQIAADYYVSSPARQLKDGRLALGMYTENAAAGGAHGAVVFSEDDGATWGKPVDIDNGGMQLDAETDVIERTDGSLYAAQRGAKNVMLSWSESTDGGKTWSVSKPTDFPGHCPYLYRAPNGIILLAQRLPQTTLRYSLDECHTWSAPILVDDFIGAYPSMVALNDGSILIVYYEEGDKSSIRARRFNVTPDGVQWISPLS